MGEGEGSSFALKMGDLFSRRVHAAQNRQQPQRRVDTAAKRF